MSQDIFFQKKRLVLALSAAAAVSFAVPAFAADGEAELEKEEIESQINSKIEWPNSEWGDKDVVITGKDGAGSVTIGKDGSIKNSNDKNYVNFDGLDLVVDGGSFENAKGTVNLKGGDATLEVKSGNFNNAGKLVIGSSDYIVHEKEEGGESGSGESGSRNGSEQASGSALNFTGGTFQNTGRIEIGDAPKEDGAAVSAVNDSERGVSVNLAKGSDASFANSGTIEVYTKGDFNINFEYADKKNDGEKADEEEKIASFNNRNGRIIMHGGDFNITSSNAPADGYDESQKVKAPTIYVGDVEMNGGVITNNDKGYVVNSKKEGDKTEDGGETEPEVVKNTYTTVAFGTVTLNDNAQFVSAAGAREQGETLEINKGSSAIFGKTSDVVGAEGQEAQSGKSVWSQVWINNEDKDSSGSKSASRYVEVAEGHKLEIETVRVSGDFEEAGVEVASAKEGVDSLIFAKKGDDLSIEGLYADHRKGKLKLTSNDMGGVKMVAGFSVNLSSALTEAEMKKTKGEGDKWTDPEVRTPSLDVSGFESSITKIDAPVENSDGGEDKPEEAKYEAQTQDFSLSVSGVSQINLSTNVGVGKETEGFDKVDSKAKFADGSKIAALTGSSMTFSDTWGRVVVDNYTKKTDEKAEGEDKPFDFTDFENKLASTQTKTQTISKSDIALTGTFGIINTSLDDKGVRDVKFIAEDGKYVEKAPEDTDDVKYDKTTEKSENKHQFISQKVEVSGSHIQAARLEVQSGEMTFTDSIGAFGSVGTIDGTLKFTNSGTGNYLGLGWMPTSDELITVGERENLVFLGQGVEIGKNGVLQIGESAGGGSSTFADGDAEGGETTPEDPVKDGNSKLNVNGTTHIVFNGSMFANSNALFTGVLGDGTTNKNSEAAFNLGNGELVLHGSDLGVGGIYITEGFNTVSGLTEYNINIDDVKIDEAWQEGLSEDGKLKVYLKKNETDGSFKVVMGGEDVKALGLDAVNSVNLVNNVLAGNRNGQSADQAFISNVLMSVHKSSGESDKRAEYSKNEAIRDLNSATAFNAATGIKALTVDFQSYVADQVEHHATRVPHNMGGWWVQPIGAKLKTDDLAAGNLTTGYSLDTYGIMGGLDTTLRNGDVWGIAGSWQSGDADSEGTGAKTKTQDLKNYGVHLWAARHYDDLAVMLMASYMKTTGEASMQTAVGTLSAEELEASAVSLGIRADLTKKFGAFELVPHAGARLLHVDMSDFDAQYMGENAFSYTEDKVMLFEVPVGITAKTAFEFQRWNVQPYVDLTLRGRFGDTNASYEVKGASGVVDKLDYDVTGKFVGDLTLGYMSTFKDLNLGMSYGFSAGDAGRQNHRFEATLRIDYE